MIKQTGRFFSQKEEQANALKALLCCTHGVCLQSFFRSLLHHPFRTPPVLARRSTHMYLSSDSLRTSTSRILSILKSSPSMSSLVTLESAMETASPSRREQDQDKECQGWCEKVFDGWMIPDEYLQPSMSLYRLRLYCTSFLLC